MPFAAHTRSWGACARHAGNRQGWLNLQKLYELRLAERENGAAIAKLPT